MAKFSVAATQLSSNDISSLAHLFATSLQFYLKHPPLLEDASLEDPYIERLKTAVGLSFVAGFVDDSLSSYIPHWHTFLSNIYFRSTTSNIGALSMAAAHMVEGGLRFFHGLSYPPYYFSFLIAMQEMLMGVMVQAPEKSEEAERLLQRVCKGE